MKILQLGNGGGLDFMKTNSAFLIEEDDSYILVDCGFNIMERLQREEYNKSNSFEISKITDVFITHGHFDHIGSLETLIYHCYFKLNHVLNVLVPDNLYSFIKNINQVYVGSQIINSTVCNIDSISIYSKVKCNGFSVSFKRVYHGNEEAYGFFFSKDRHGIFISGDTKANPSIEEFVNSEIKDKKIYKCLIYHDFSNFNVPSRNIHACESDFEAEYSEDFKNKVTKYHNNEKFNEDWIEF